MMILLGLLTVPILLLFNIYKSHQLPLPQSLKIDSLDSRSGDISDFLFKFGYIPKDDFRVGSIRSSDYLKDAIKRMQKFAGLPATGEIDAATFNLTKRPRCGVPDYFPSDIRNRVKRYVLKGPKWDKTSLTWSINGSTPSTMRRTVLDSEIYQALLLWSRHSKLKFYPSGSNPADIVITFFSRDHGDNLAFDGNGGVLAHAFFPGPDFGGDVHFDADETWAETERKDPSGTGLFGVAAHEFGHSLGLSHSPIVESLMFPYYRDIDFDFELPQDDINGIQALYGPSDTKWPTHKPTTKFTTPRPNRPTTYIPKITEPPTTCDTSFDAISTIRSEIFIFKGRYFWRLDENKNLERDYAIPVNNFWFNLPKDFEKIDAVYERPLDSKIVFFLGGSYWVFDGNHAESGYPKPLYDLGLPRNLKSVDAVTTWGYNGLVYIFAGNQYWRLDERTNRVELDYPRSMKIWKGVPTNLDAAFHWQKNGRTYFFKGRGFWLFDDRTMSVTPDSPQSSVHYWFDPLCKNAPYPDLNDISSTEPSIRDVNSSPSSRILITFSYFVFLLLMLSSFLVVFNHSVNIS